MRPNLHFEDMTGSAATSPSYDPGVPARRLRALVCALAVLAALGVAGPALAAQTGFVSALGQTVSGPDKATDLGVGWVRLFLNWKDSEPADGAFNAPYFDLIAREVAAYRARGVKVLVVATSAPQWASGSASGIAPPTDPAQYAAFVDHAMTQLPGVTAWEVWNEADGSLFWENGPQ
ncbi:MAG: polysaccharide biosynthesis protein PslG, partial [Solirubrobacteraceae bacterium]|nr:polysaccharide biosynthesis protein PslG [Solirubrobacteraceae bacterium]